MGDVTPFRRTGSSPWTRPEAYRAARDARASGLGRGWGRFGPIAWFLPLALFAGVLAWPAPQDGPATVPQQGETLQFGAQPREQYSAHFAKCGGWAGRDACVVDGDTIWFRGEKIRLADYNTPETYQAKCDYERDLGTRATARFTELLNAGPFTLTPEAGRTHDRYGRALFTVTRGGRSLGDVLVAEGLAERWTGRRREWC